MLLLSLNLCAEAITIVCVCVHNNLVRSCLYSYLFIIEIVVVVVVDVVVGRIKGFKR